MSAASHLVLRNQDTAIIVERRRRNYFLLYAMLRDVAPPVTGELKPGVCPLFYPMPIEDKAGAMARLLARGVETVDFWRLRHPAVPAGPLSAGGPPRGGGLGVPGRHGPPPP